jgi:hypothetical protein
VFAGAAREAVFSRPEVIGRVRADFVPVALKAALVNNPPDGEEGQFYREIGRSKPAPQGICVINPNGKVLTWALMFDDDKSVVAFLDHTLMRFARYPDAKQAVPAERYMRFPSVPVEDVADTRQPLPAGDRHAAGQHCPGTPPMLPGTVVARLFGRALDPSGRPVADTVRQEHYVEDRFDIPVELQDRLAGALAAAGGGRFRLPDELARTLVSHAYLGQLDVNPCGPPGGRGDLKQCEFWAERTAGGPTARLRIDGRSEAAGGPGDGDRGDGRLWHHEVKLTWEGLIEMDGRRVRRLLLLARGTEKLRWGNERMGQWAEADVTHLPGGHAIDLACGVRYGVVGEPAPADRVAADAPAALAGRPAGPVPEDVRRQLVEAFGPTFAVFRGRVQEELKLSPGQRENVQGRLAATVQDAQAFFQKLQDTAAEDRGREHAAYRERAEQALKSFLEETLDRDQLRRLRQLELQQQGLFALMQPDLAADLKVTAEQGRQFRTVIEGLQNEVQSLVRQAPAGGDPTDIRAKMLKFRQEHERRLEALLSDTQKERWRELLGKPFDLAD